MPVPASTKLYLTTQYSNWSLFAEQKSQLNGKFLLLTPLDLVKKLDLGIISYLCCHLHSP